MKLDLLLPRARILLVVTDTEGELAKEVGIRQIPTFFFIGTLDSSQPSLVTQGLASVDMLLDITKTKLQYAGKNLILQRRL